MAPERSPAASPAATPSSSSSKARKRKMLDIVPLSESQESSPPSVRKKLPGRSSRGMELAIYAPREYVFRVLLPNQTNVTFALRRSDGDLAVAEFLRLVRRKVAEFEDKIGKGSRKIHWGAHMFLEDLLGNRIADGEIFPANPDDSPVVLVLHDAAENTVHTHQDMWDVTPNKDLLDALPDDYSLETALADLIDNSLQAVWANKDGERRLISITLKDREISIFDSGQGMDSGVKNSIANWGTMGSSLHKDVRSYAIGGNPPYLKPFFGMYGCGGVRASLHLGGLVIVSSKTKTAKKVVTLRLEKEVLKQESKSDRIWRTPGAIREISEDEQKMSPHGSFTKVHISKLKSNYWKEEQLKCMLKDIYFPYIQNDGSNGSSQTSMPVEFEVNGTNLTDVIGGEVVETNLAACNGPVFSFIIHLTKKIKVEEHSQIPSKNTADSANAMLSCFYFPISQGKETIDKILENLKRAENCELDESFESFCRVSIRRLGRLLPDARWGRLPFMDCPKHRRAERTSVPTQCFKRVKCFVETDAGFVPTPSKTELCNNDAFTRALKGIGRKFESHEISMEIRKEEGILNPSQLEDAYYQWLKQMHETYDEEVECYVDNDTVLIANPSNLKELGFSNSNQGYGKVIRVMKKIRSRSELWQSSQRIKIRKGICGLKKDLYATLELFLCEGFEGDPGEARMICRPIGCKEEDGSKIVYEGNIPRLILGSSESYPLDLVSVGKCELISEETFRKQIEKLHFKAPSFIDVLNTEDGCNFDFAQGLLKGLTLEAGCALPKEIIAVVRPHSFRSTTDMKSVDKWNQKFIFKECMNMQFEINSIDCECNGDCLHGNLKVKLPMKYTSRSQLDGLYCLSMDGSGISEILTKAGKYRFIFSLVGCLYSDVKPTTINVLVNASDKIGKLKCTKCLSAGEHGILERTTVRLGSEIGPLYMSCYDIYSNQMEFKSYPSFVIDIIKNGIKVDIKIQKVKGDYTEDKMYLKLIIVLGGGDIGLLRPSFDALLRFSIGDSCLIDIPVRVLPGVAKKAKLLSDDVDSKLDMLLRPGTIISKFQLEALDAYGNPVEKGQKLKIELNDLEFQDQKFQCREVDEEGCINLGGLLKVVGRYGTIGSIQVSFDSDVLLVKKFQILKRHLKIMSEVPDQCYAGSVLENIEFAVTDDYGNIDKDISGCHHALIIDLRKENEVQYIFREGKCRVPKIQLPDEGNEVEFITCHAVHSELAVVIKIGLLAKSAMDVVCVPEQAGDGCSTKNMHEQAIIPVFAKTPVKSESFATHELLSFIDDMTIWQEDLRDCGVKVKNLEDEMESLERKLTIVENHLKELKRELNKQSNSLKIGNAGKSVGVVHSLEETLQEIRQLKFAASAIWVDFVNTKTKKHSYLHENVVGVVALLGQIEEEPVNRVLSEYLGIENMQAIVCKNRSGVEALEKYDNLGNLNVKTGIHSVASERNLQINGRFRAICLEDIWSYEGETLNDPQETLNIQPPLLLNGLKPAGFLGYAVNMIKLNKENPYLSKFSAAYLRRTLFFHLFSYLQVYETRNDMKQALPSINHGAVSLDGGILRQKGVIDCGRRGELPVRFPTTFGNISHSFDRALLRTQIEEVEEEKKVLEAELKRVSDKMHKAKKKFNDKRRELESKEEKKNAIIKKCQVDER